MEEKINHSEVRRELYDGAGEALKDARWFRRWRLRRFRREILKMQREHYLQLMTYVDYSKKEDFEVWPWVVLALDELWAYFPEVCYSRK